MATTEGSGYLIQDHEMEELTGRLRWRGKVLEQEWRKFQFRNGYLLDAVDEWRPVPEADE